MFGIKIIKNVYNLCKYKKSKNQTKPKIVLQFIITAYNEHEVGKISILAKKLGVDNISFKTISVTEKTKHFLPKNNLYTRYIKNKEKSVWCPALWDKMAIFSDGQATLCCKAFDVKEKINIGNVFEKNLDSIWNGEKYKKYRQLMLLANKDLIGCNSTCPSGQNPFLK